MIRRHPWWTATFAGLALLIGLSIGWADRQIVINTSESMPPGLYVRTRGPLTVGQIVDFVIPPTARDYIRQRTGRDGTNWYLLKPIAAGPGDLVDTTGDTLRINGQPHGPIAGCDGSRRPLPHWRACRRLGADEFFVISERVPNSFDSRYFGPIHRDQIAAVRRPILTW